jgi:hypothetical protein
MSSQSGVNEVFVVSNHLPREPSHRITGDYPLGGQGGTPDSTIAAYLDPAIPNWGDRRSRIWPKRRDPLSTNGVRRINSTWKLITKVL